MKILNVVGARPNFMKIGPIISAIRDRSNVERARGRSEIRQFLVHTGQHYDRELSALFFEQLGIPTPDVNLGVGSGSHVFQTAEVMKKFEVICLEQRPSHVLVVGDVNSTIACALVAVKMGIATMHVEAGLRSFDRTMPEEINRILTDAISDELFTTEESANQNLRHEGISENRIHFVGNVMIDSLLQHQKKAEESTILARLSLANGSSEVKPYAVLTLHRPSTVDDQKTLGQVVDAMAEISKDLPIIFPVHPRTRSRIAAYGLDRQFRYVSLHGDAVHGEANGIIATQPLGYIDFLHLMSRARVVLTDSGGIQEETTILGVPCVTLRDSTERPVTVTQGTNVLAGVAKGTIIERTHAQLLGKRSRETVQPPLWDGKAAQRIVDVLMKSID